MSDKAKVKSGFFVDRTVCPVCQGAGCVDCCQTGDVDCVTIPCDYCQGKGVLAEVKKERIFLLAVIVLMVVGTVAILM
ncbi:hypothetical protein ACKQTC_08375 [Peptococcus simiae]|uniref:Molecular chaperone DnaJ n=1 Tax=Peptococcus simiae TaxID=1643805 RepID=A0ABW9H0K2_9FIRM